MPLCDAERLAEYIKWGPVVVVKLSTLLLPSCVVIIMFRRVLAGQSIRFRLVIRPISSSQNGCAGLHLSPLSDIAPDSSGAVDFFGGAGNLS